MAQYYTLITAAGLAYEAQCKASGQPIALASLSVGDGAGAAYDPTGAETALKGEKWRGDLTGLEQNAARPSWLEILGTVPASAGGFTIREVAIWTRTGVLYAIGKYPASEKPTAASGVAKEFAIRVIVATSNAASVTLQLDSSQVMASRDWTATQLASAISAHEAKADPHPQYLTEQRGKALPLASRAKRLFHSSGT